MSALIHQLFLQQNQHLGQPGQKVWVYREMLGYQNQDLVLTLQYISVGSLDAFWILNTKIWCSTSEVGDKSEHLCPIYRFPSSIFLAVQVYFFLASCTLVSLRLFRVVTNPEFIQQQRLGYSGCPGHQVSQVSQIRR